jgi:hypothetical protein
VVTELQLVPLLAAYQIFPLGDAESIGDRSEEGTFAMNAKGVEQYA